MSDWVLLRGLAREAGHWGPFVQQLAEAQGAAVHAVDLPGNGLRHAERSPLSVAAMVDAVRGALAARGVQRPVRVLALSLGGMVAMHWAARFPQEVARLVLINTSARPYAPLSWRLRPATAWPLLRSLVGHNPVALEHAVLRATSAHAGDAVLESWLALRAARPVRRRNVMAQLIAAARFRAPPHLSVPALLLAGAGDRLVDPRCSERLARQWSVPLRVHASAGHDLPLDDPGWVLDQLGGCPAQ